MTAAKKIRIAILGLGTVGFGVYELLKRREDELVAKTGLQAEVARVLVRNAGKAREGICPALLTDQFEEILKDPSIDIIVEIMGGIEPAYTYITEERPAV